MDLIVPWLKRPEPDPIDIDTPEGRARLNMTMQEALIQDQVKKAQGGDYGLLKFLGGVSEPGETLTQYTNRTLLDPRVKERGSLLPWVRRDSGHVEFGAPEVAVDLAKAFGAFGHAAQGGTVTPEEAAMVSLDLAGGGLLSSRAPGAVPKGNVLGIFAGPSAKTADKKALSLAKQLAEKGASRDEIWRDTGWFKDVDGAWKFEIDDSGAKAIVTAPKNKSRIDFAKDYYELTGHPPEKFATGQLPEVDKQALKWADLQMSGNPVPVSQPVAGHLQHPDLYDAYDFSETTAVRAPGMRELRGSFDPSMDEITYGGGIIGRYGDDKSTLLHELQHAVQHREGFAKGGSPTEFRYLKGSELARGVTPYEKYKRLAGEAEARNVQKRMDYTAAQRQAEPPWSTLDVPENELIVRKDYSGPMEAVRAASKGAGKLGSKAAKKKKAVGSVFDDIDDIQKAYAMARAGAHLKRDPAGKYVGAPPDVTSPQALGQLRKRMLNKLDKGKYGADWYDRGRDEIKLVSGTGGAQEEAMQRLLARGGAAHSPQATPNTETNFFLKQHNARQIHGEHVVPRTKTAAKAQAMGYTDDWHRLTPENIKLGRKTGPYAESKDPTIDINKLFRSANDLWMGRGAGYKNKGGAEFNRGFTPQEHNFMLGENLVLADSAQQAGIPMGHRPDLPWTPQRGQAAIWTGDRYDSYKKKPAYKKYTEEELRAAAAYGIDDALRTTVGSETYEYAPGLNTGHLPGLTDNPQAARAHFEAMAAAHGARDPYYEALGMYQYPAKEVPGVYVNSAGVTEYNPAMVARPLIDRASVETPHPTNPRKTRKITEVGEPSRSAMDEISYLRSVANAQEMGGWNKFYEKGKASMMAGDINAAEMTVPAEMLDDVVRAIGEKGLNHTVVAEPGQPGAHTVRLLRWEGDMSNKDLRAKFKQLGKQFPDLNLREGLMYYGSQSPAWGAPGSGQVTRQMIDRLEQSPVADLPQRLDRSRVPRVLGELNSIDRSVGVPPREDILKLRALLSDPNVGYTGLAEYVKKYGAGGLPAIAALGLIPPDDEQ